MERQWQSVRVPGSAKQEVSELAEERGDVMHCVAVMEGLSVEVYFQLRTEGQRRARHVHKEKRKGCPGHVDA